MRIQWTRLILAVGVLLLATNGPHPKPAKAYENLGPAGPGASLHGPHQMINRYAVRIWVDWRGHKGVFKNYRFQDPRWARKLTGQSFGNTGLFYSDLTTVNKALTWSQWLMEGGYTADEPELWQALRHFYDPTRPSAPWLSDRHAGLYSATWKVGSKVYADPKMDAITWAVTGPARNGQPENAFSWKKAGEYMRQAWSCTSSPEEKDRLFAAAWRSIGETMHLVADMTTPAHVRNDAHAAKLPSGSMGPDPYETRVSEGRIKGICDGIGRHALELYPAFRDRVDNKLRPQIQSASEPATLMHAVAKWTNENFFSKDTVAGIAEIHRRDGSKVRVTVTNANGMPPYPAPRLEDCRVDPVFEGHDELTTYTRKVTGHDVAMARLTWTSEWHGFFKTALRWKAFIMEDDVALSQANILIPLAVLANTHVVDWAIPRVEVVINDIDQQTKRLQAEVLHTPSGLYATPLSYSTGAGPAWKRFAHIKINGRTVAPASCKLTVSDNRIQASLSGLDLRRKRVQVVIDLGGFTVESEPFVCFITPKKKPRLKPRPSYVGLYYVRVRYNGDSFDKPVGFSSSNPDSVASGGDCKIVFRKDGTITHSWNRGASTEPCGQWQKDGAFTIRLDDDKAHRNWTGRVVGRGQLRGKITGTFSFPKRDQSGRAIGTELVPMTGEFRPRP